LAQESSEYIINVGTEQLHFVAHPGLGYVVKTEEETGGISAMSSTIRVFGAKDIRRVGGLGRRGTWVIYDQRPATENEKTIKTLRKHAQIKYVAPLFSSNGETIAIIPEIVVRLMSETDAEQLQALCQTMDLTIKKRMEFTDCEHLIEVLGNDASAVFSAVEQLNTVDWIEWAAPNIAFQPRLCGQLIPNDEYFTDQWHLHNTGQTGGTPDADINAPEAWEITTGDPNIVVAVLDTGIDYNHEDLKENIWRNPIEQPGDGNGDGAPGLVGIDDDGDGLIDEDSNNLQPGEPNYTNDLVNDDDENGFVDDVYGWDFYNDDSSPIPNWRYYFEIGESTKDDNAHGTKCAGLIAAKGNNDIGVAGVAWNCKIMPIRIVSVYYKRVRDPYNILKRGYVLFFDFHTQADIATAIRYAAEMGADVLSNSWILIPPPEPIIKQAIIDVTKPGGMGRNGKGCVVLACSGNDGTDSVTNPARLPEVIAVGATDHNDLRWSYSNYGSGLDLVAPSGCSSEEECDYILEFLTTSINSSYTNADGTSAACPVAAGVAALVLSIDPSLTNTEVRRILSRSAHDLGPPGWDEEYGFGRVDAYAAVTMALNPPEPVLFVDDDAPNDSGPGDPNVSDPLDGSAEHPFDTIQESINNAITGDTVIVMPGTYTGEGNRDIDFHGRIITVRSIDGPESCIIDCQNSGCGFYFHSGEGVNSVLEGFTITNGNADDGGGMYIYDSSPTINNCMFIGNSAEDDGGGIYIWSGDPNMINCIFSGNSANFGGGIYNSHSNPKVTNCIFSGNSAYDGGGVYNYKSNSTLTNCIFSGNSAGSGGGMYNDDSNPTVANCTFKGNSAELMGGAMRNSFISSQIVNNCMFRENSADSGGGISNASGSSSIVTNCTFSGNSASDIGGAMYNPTKVTNCILWGDTPDEIYAGIPEVTYSDVQGGWSGETNINFDPLFADTNNGDYHLKSQAGRWDPVSQSWIIDDVTSPCIDAGQPSTSIGSEPSPNGDIINMGAYGGTDQASKSPEN